MALDDLLISTGVDNLIRLVHERGRVEMKAAAVELNVPLQSVEDWAHVLETEGIIKIQYQLTQIYLVWASMSPTDFAVATKTVEVRKTQTVQKLTELSDTLDKSMGELDELQGQFSELEQKTRSGLEALSTDRSEADRLSAQAEQIIGEKSARLTELKADLEQFHGELERFGSAMERGPGAGARAGAAGRAGATDAGAQMNSLIAAQARLNEMIRSSEEQYASLDGQVRTLQEQMGNDKTDADLGEMKTALEDLTFAKTEMTKNAQTMLGEIKALGAEIDHLAERLDEAQKRKETALNPKKMMATLESLSRQAAREHETTLSELTKNLEDVRKQIQSYSQAQYQYQNIKTHLESLQTQYAKESEELEEFLTLLDGASKRYAKDLETAKGSLATGAQEYEAMLQKAEGVQSVLTQIETLRGEGEALSSRLRGVLKEAQVVALQSPVLAPARAPAGAGQKPGAYGNPAAYAPPGTPGARPAGRAAPAAAAPAGAGAAPAGGADNLPPELAQRVALTTNEEEQFEKKREELRNLIRKMWDEDRKPPSA